jgi:2-desacetyl-2-hydroxyethyl bacteriochlorophyllide A dehydrogenase
MGKVEMREIPLPSPGPGQVVVKTTLSSICGTDLHFVDEFPMFPGVEAMPMGHEAVGVVQEVGAGVSRFKPGDRLITSCLSACGACKQCLLGDYSACTGGGNLLFGCQADYFLVPFADVTAARIPDDLTDEQVLFAGDIMSTGFGAIERSADWRIGDSVAIFGQGPVGLCATAAARALGAGLVIAVEPVAERQEMARRLGANVVLDPGQGDVVAGIKDLTGGQGVDVAVEAIGLQETFDACANAVRRGGAISSVGVYGAIDRLGINTRDMAFFHRRVITTLCPVGNDRLMRLMDVVRHGRLDLTPLWTHALKISETPKAYDLFRSRSGGVLKIALRP